MSEVISKVMPIVLLVSLGIFIRYKNIFLQKSINEIKKFLVNFVLPAVLFITFFNMDLRKEYFLISITVFILLNVIFVVGFAKLMGEFWVELYNLVQICLQKWHQKSIKVQKMVIYLFPRTKVWCIIIPVAWLIK